MSTLFFPPQPGWVSPIYPSQDSNDSSHGSREREDGNDSSPVLKTRARAGTIEIVPLADLDYQALPLTPLVASETRARTNSYSKSPRTTPKLPASKWLYAIPALTTISAIAQTVLTGAAIFSHSENVWMAQQAAEISTVALVTASFVATGMRVTRAYNLYGTAGIRSVVQESLFKPFFREGIIITTLVSLWPLVADA
jgi:hypothetical protein